MLEIRKLKYAEDMALCLINGVTLRNLPYGSHKNVYGATVMYGKLDKSFDMCYLSLLQPVSLIAKKLS